jgi:hypothetical protein
MNAVLRMIGSLLLLATTAAAEAQSTRMFETVLVTPRPIVAGQPVFATMVWRECSDTLRLVGGTVSLAAPNVIRVRAEFEGFGGRICSIPNGTSASLPFHAPTAGTWSIDFAGTVRYRTSDGAWGPPIPISLLIPPPAVVVNEPAPIPATSWGGLAALSLLLALVALTLLPGRIAR